MTLNLTAGDGWDEPARTVVAPAALELPSPSLRASREYIERFRERLPLARAIRFKCGACMGGDPDRMPPGEVARAVDECTSTACPLWRRDQPVLGEPRQQRPVRVPVTITGRSTRGAHQGSVQRADDSVRISARLRRLARRRAERPLDQPLNHRARHRRLAGLARLVAQHAVDPRLHEVLSLVAGGRAR